MSSSNSIGDNLRAGTRCFSIFSFDSTNNTISVDSTNGMLENMLVSYKLDHNYDAYSKIVAVVSPTTVSVDRVLTSFTEEDIAALDSKTAHIWIVGHPELGSSNTYEGNAIAVGADNIAQAYAAFAEGSGNKAIGRQSHAEGRNNTVYAYAGHAEGLGNEVFAKYSHAEGGYNKAVGSGHDDYVHVEGF